jgi:glutamate carboxypeptidase
MPRGEDDLVAELEELVALESPSDDKRALDAFAAVFADKAAAIDGARVELIEAADAGNHVRAEWGESDRNPVLLLGHYDTVWPVCTLSRKPFKRERDRAYGPGILDMKVGLLRAVAQNIS